MSKRGTILLAIGLLIVGLVLGAIAGGLTGRYLARRSVGLTAMRMAPSAFGGRGMMPFNAPRGGFGTTPFVAPRGGFGATPFYGPRGGFGATPFHGPQRGFGAAPFSGPQRGFGATPFFGQRRQFAPQPFGTQRGAARRALAARFAIGVRVTNVEANSAAEKAGLKAGDVITTVAGTKIDATHSVASLLKLHKPGDKVDLGITRGGQAMTISATLGASPQNSSTAYLGVRYGLVPAQKQPKQNFR